MNIQESPVLGEPPANEQWAMISRHPFYPSIELFRTEQEAIEAARKEIADMHYSEEEVHSDSYVSVAKLTLKANINTAY